MSGIAGFLNFSCDANNQKSILKRMLLKINYGNETEVLNFSCGCALGMLHQKNKNISSNKEVNTNDSNWIVQVVFDGTLYNEKELKHDIKAAGKDLFSTSTCDIIKVAYQIWGKECFKRFDGAFAIALWDSKKQELMLVRDFLGIQPLYYYPEGQTLCFGSTPKAIIEYPDVNLKVDGQGLCSILSFVKNPGDAIFCNMKEVLPGTSISITKENTKVDRYWSLDLRDHNENMANTIDNIQGILEDSVERRLPSSIQLSGGLDSCTLLAIATKINKEKNGGSLQTFSAKWEGQDFPEGTPDDFNMEEVNVIKMVNQVGAMHKDIHVDVAQLLDEKHVLSSIVARDLPIGLGDMDMLYYLFYQGIKNHSNITISGEGADELFGGYFWFHNVDTVNARTFPFSTVNTCWGTGDASASVNLISSDLRRRMKFEQYEQDNYNKALSNVPKIDSTDEMEKKMNEICYLHLTHWTPILLDRRDRVSRALGMEVHLPFCDKKLVEYVFSIPWKMKKFDNYSKSLLRAVATKYIPKEVAYQGKSAWVANQPPQYDYHLRLKLYQLLRSGKAPVSQLLDQGIVKALISDPMSQNGLTTHEIGGVLRLNQWLDTYNVSISGI